MFRKCIPIALFFQTLNLFGITDTWTGTSSADWGTPGNWQSMTVPGTTLGGGDVAILSGAMNNIILLGMPMPAVRTLGELDLNLGAGYTINPAGGSFAFQVSTGGSAQLNVNDGPNVSMRISTF